LFLCFIDAEQSEDIFQDNETFSWLHFEDVFGVLEEEYGGEEHGFRRDELVKRLLEVGFVFHHNFFKVDVWIVDELGDDVGVSLENPLS
jgi:hypothetical protein